MVNCYVEHVEGGGIWDVAEFEATTLKLRFDGKNFFVCVVIILILYFVANFFLGFVLRGYGRHGLAQLATGKNPDAPLE